MKVRDARKKEKGKKGEEGECVGEGKGDQDCLNR